MSLRISVFLAALAVFSGVAAKSEPQPKLKNVGNISVEYVSGKTPVVENLAAEWHTGLEFRNAPQVHAAVCVYDPAHDDWHVGGIHLTSAAARQLASDLVRAAGTHGNGGVEIVNHRNHRPNIWITLRPTDADALSNRITAAARGHIAS